MDRERVNRCVTVKPTKSHHIQIDYDKNIEHYRITGPLSEIMELSALATADIHWSTKQHHVEADRRPFDDCNNEERTRQSSRSPLHRSDSKSTRDRRPVALH